MEMEIGTDDHDHQLDAKEDAPVRPVDSSDGRPLDPAKFTARLDHMVGDIK